MSGSRAMTSESGLRAARQTSMARISLGVSLAWIRAAEAGSSRVEQPVEPGVAVLLAAAAQPVAQIILAGRSGEEPVGERAEVEAGSAGDDGQASSAGNFAQGGPGRAGCIRPP